MAAAALKQRPGQPQESGNEGGLYGVACVHTAMLVAALTHVSTLRRTSIASGLARVGNMDLSFPAGPANFNNAANPTGGQFWRPLTYRNSCNCWKVTSTAWRKQFT
jgi:hypothetical protein